MSGFPGSPRLRKGALVSVKPTQPLAGIIVFQYNPATLRRTVEARPGAGPRSSARGENQRLGAAPRESISVEVQLDAADPLEADDAVTRRVGLHPQLAALEMLLFPTTIEVLANAALAKLGSIEVRPPPQPLTLFVWGVKRVLPVRVTGFSVEEERFDAALNPTRARVSLSLEVQTYDDLGWTHPGSYVYMANHVAREALAMLNGATTMTNLDKWLA